MDFSSPCSYCAVELAKASILLAELVNLNTDIFQCQLLVVK